jgi:hypothetical protein
MASDLNIQIHTFDHLIRPLRYQNEVTLSIDERAAEGKAERLPDLGGKVAP